MKQQYFLVFALFIANVYYKALAQIPNSGFETWINHGSYEDPEDWGTGNSLGIYTCTKVSGTDAYSGSYAIRLETKNIVGWDVTGIALTGTIVLTQTDVEMNGGFSYNQRPVKLSGFYKYTPAASDSSLMSIILWKWNATDNKRDTIGIGSFKSGDMISSYTAFDVTINYLLPDAPDSAMILLQSSYDPFNANSGSVLYVDDLSFTITPGFEEFSSGINTICFPNPANNILNIKISSLKNLDAKLFVRDELGRILSTADFKNEVALINVEGYKNGIYFYQIVEQNGNILSSKRFIINN